MFPLAIIDFEASALDPNSYPIEVGVAVVDAAGAVIRVWSTLIRPAPQWEACGWDPDAQKVHGISRRDLRGGMSASETTEMLDTLLAPIGTAWSDGGHYDTLWLRVLFEAAGTQPRFTLGDLPDLLDSKSGWADYYRAVIARDRPPHRAGPDARRIAAALVEIAMRRP